jgi:neurotransmitter:Na+ symporter, NSS family
MQTPAAQTRSIWSSKLGFLLAAIGSAVGLGNIWRFSYMVHQHGGGAFLVPYLVALAIAGISLMILEYALGHREKGSPPLACARVAKRWERFGWWMPTAALFGIMLYYAVIIGWCFNYLTFSFNLSWGADPETFFFKDFLRLSDSPFELGGVRLPILLSTGLVWLLCWFICYREIHHGIEKACMIFMPLLFVMTLILVAWSVNLEGARSAIVDIYLKPDWSKINVFGPAGAEAWKVWMAAFGQIFFTLSLGFGIMITYASYLPRKTDIIGNALWTAVINCAYSILAGFAVFGVVGFMAQQSGVAVDEVIKSGPQLAFVVYPKAISQLPFGQQAFGVIFFAVLIVAGLSSGISLIEAFTCSICDKFAWSRRRTVNLLCSLGLLGSLIFTTRAGLLILDIADHFITNYGLVVAGICECVLVAWVLKSRRIRTHIKRVSGRRLWKIWDIAVGYIVPLLLAAIVSQSLLGELRAAYGGYSVPAVLLYGVGWLAATLLAAVLLAACKWEESRRQHLHRPEDEHLLT